MNTPWLVEVAGIEPASSSFAVGLLRAQPVAKCREWRRTRRTRLSPAGKDVPGRSTGETAQVSPAR
jgi:hypothetical protein